MGGNPFEPFKTYKATIWVDNGECIAWDRVNMPFFICPSGTGCKLTDGDISLSFYPNPATEEIFLKGIDNIHPGDPIDVNIQDVRGNAIKHVQSQKESRISYRQAYIFSLPFGTRNY